MRERSVDVLRGLAIVGMVLSGTISRNSELPAWLFHAQIAPPDFTFNPGLPGLTWVDLVFPFFIFAMGVAIPYSLGGLIHKGAGFGAIVRKLVVRSMRLFVFAVLLGQLSPWHYPGVEGYYPWLAALLSFAGFFLAFGRLPFADRYQHLAEAAGYVLLITLIVVRHSVFGLAFSFNKNDIIMLVLANLAFFGGLIWLFTHTNPTARLAVMALVFVLRLTHGVEGSVNQWLWSLSPAKLISAWLPWLQELLSAFGDLNKTVFYNPEFLKYLLILIPGTLAGDILLSNKARPAVGSRAALVFVITVVFNTWALQARETGWFWAFNIILGLLLIRRRQLLPGLQGKDLHIALWSYAWLLIGTAFEAWEGGIKKDPSTYSYLFVTAALSGFSLLALRQAVERQRWKNGLSLLANTGMNPMIGYVVVSYAIAPLLQFVHILSWMDRWHLAHPWLGVLRGLVLTLMMMFATQWFTNKKLFWKT
ncbi:MAG: DUF5009 domain-containing protein [Bacteroidetes bacterium]|nr:DUF5009 domain-containing protein [Bacteroidota bacterium]